MPSDSEARQIGAYTIYVSMPKRKIQLSGEVYFFQRKKSPLNFEVKKNPLQNFFQKKFFFHFRDKQLKKIFFHISDIWPLPRKNISSYYYFVTREFRVVWSRGPRGEWVVSYDRQFRGDWGKNAEIFFCQSEHVQTCRELWAPKKVVFLNKNFFLTN